MITDICICTKSERARHPFRACPFHHPELYGRAARDKRLAAAKEGKA